MCSPNDDDGLLYCANYFILIMSELIVVGTNSFGSYFWKCEQQTLIVKLSLAASSSDHHLASVSATSQISCYCLNHTFPVRLELNLDFIRSSLIFSDFKLRKMKHKVAKRTQVSGNSTSRELICVIKGEFC